MDEKDAKNCIQSVEQDALNAAKMALSGYTGNVKDIVATLVSSLCDVDKQEMLNEPRVATLVYARWFYWYVIKQLYGMTNESISKQSFSNRRFNISCVTQGILKMSMLIQSNTIWTKRWSIMKRVIMDANKVEQPELFAQNITVKITHPKGVNIEIKEE